MACITKRRGRLVLDFYDQHGRRRLKTLKPGTTMKTARKELSEIEAQVERSTYLPRRSIPPFSDVATDWLTYKAPQVRSSTYEQYEGHVRNHLQPYFGQIKINRINFNAVERFVTALHQAGMIAPTVKKVLTTLGGILRYAVRRGLTYYNPVSDIERPRDHRQQEMDFLRPEEIRALLAHTEGRLYRMLFFLAVMTGARQGELLGLKWTDIDWFNSQLHIRRTFNHFRFHEPKSKASRRAIDLGPAVLQELRKWKLACPPSELDLVFPNEEGKPLDCRNLVQRHFHKALAAAKLRRIRFHDLRHTYATLLIAQGEHPKLIQSQLGHHSINVTMDVYGHLMETVNTQAPQRLEATVLGKNGEKMVTSTKKGLDLER